MEYSIEFYIAFYVTIALIIFFIVRNKKRKKAKELEIKELKRQNEEFQKLKNQLEKTYRNEAYLIFPYKRCDLLTTNEFYFYKSLKDITDKMDLTILSKVRLADLIKINDELNEKEKQSYTSKILSKHVDFILCDKNNLNPKLIIELNDNTHKSEERIERDRFIKTILEKCGYKILFTYGTGDLENKIINLLQK